MFPLLELPVELIEHVVAVVHPRDIEALHRCGSRLIRDLTKKPLVEHYEFKGKYTCIILCGEEPYFRDASCKVDDRRALSVIPVSAPDIMHYRSRSSMLMDVFRNRNLASYPRYVSLDSFPPGEHSTYGPLPLHEEDETEWSNIMSDVTAFVESLNIPTDMKTTWVEAIYSRKNNSAAVALVLSLLTDVRIVKMENWRIGVEEIDPLWTIVTHIALNNRNTSKPGDLPISEKPLSRLQKFLIDAEWNRKNSIQVFVPFASLPSIRDLYGVHISDRTRSGKISAWQWPIGFPGRGSSVTSIHLHDSSVGATTFESYLGGIASLREFTYLHNQYLTTKTIQWDPSGIVAALRRHAANSPMSLSLTTRPKRVLARTDDVQGEFVGSLQMFAALKYVRMDDRLLAGPEWAFSHLVDVLPRTMEYLTLIPDRWWKAREQSWGVVSPQNERLRGLFRDFSKLRKQFLPDLKKVVIENYWPVDDLRQSLRAVEGVCASLQCQPLRWMESNRCFIEYTTSRKGRREVWYWPATWPRRPRERNEGEWEWEY